MTNSVIARFMRAIQFPFSGGEKWVARTSRAMTVFFVLGLTIGVAGCGVKSDLLMPDGKPTPKGQKDPSKPPPQQQQQGL
jgi:predicted small lipoprotein YifL